MRARLFRLLLIPAGLGAQDVSGVGLLTRPIDTTITLASWRAAHPTDSVLLGRPSGLTEEFFCRASSARVQLLGEEFTRSAVFIVPRPPSGEALPSDTTLLADRVCRLGGMWLEAAVGGDRATTVADSLHTRIAAVLGTGKPGLEMMGQATGTWFSTTSWRIAGTTVVIGIVPGYESPPDLPRVVIEPRVVVASFVPTAGVGDDMDERLILSDVSSVDPERTTALARADSALARSAFPEVTADVRRVLAAAADTAIHQVRRSAVDSALVRLVTTTRNRAAALPAPRRAAALLAADIAVHEYAGRLDAVGDTDPDHLLRLRLSALGIPYENSPLGSVDVYTRPWLWDAYRLDSAGVSGRSAFAELLRAGWTTQPVCGGGEEEFRAVIEQGERALRRGNTDPMVHYHVAQAYADIVALATGALSSYADSGKYQQELPVARERAIARYRSALEGLRDPQLRRTAWTRAIRLMLGLSNETRYFCVYD